jgi:predicted HTH domain antitoxin
MMVSQGVANLNIVGPPPPASPFAYRFSDEPFSERDRQAERSFLPHSESAVLIQSNLAGPNVEERLATLSALVNVPLSMEVVSGDGAAFGLTGLLFTITRDEAGDITFNNEVTESPLRVKVTTHKATGEMSLHINLNYVGLNVQLAYDGARFLEVLSRGGEFRMVYKVSETETDVTFLRGNIPAGVYPGPEPNHLKLLEQLALIQSKTGARLTIPEGGISSEQAQNIRVVARIVETGRITYPVPSWNTTLHPEHVQTALETFANGKTIPIVMNYLEEQAMPVLGTEVPLGPMLVGVTRVYMTPDDYEALRSAAESAEPDSMISARMSPFEDCQAEAHYMRYLPVDHAAAIYRMVIFQQVEPEQFLEELLRASKQGTENFITRFAELLAALRKNVLPHEAITANPLVTCSPEELLVALSSLMSDLDQKARFVLAALLFKYDVLSSGKASRFAGMDRVSFLMSLHKVGVAVIDFDEQDLRDQAEYANAE